MVSAPLRVLFTASECAPFVKTGGLGDVVGALPKYLRQRGIDVRVVLPLHAGIAADDLELLDGELIVPMGFGLVRAGVRMGELPGSEAKVYFIEHLRYFDRADLYGTPSVPYGDNLERFAFLSRASLELCKALRWIPDVIHAHDWHTALAPVYINTVEWGQPLHRSATVLTVHNLAHQGLFTGSDLWITGLGVEHFRPDELEHHGAVNLLKGGLYHATSLTTVSPTYAREIQQPEHGCGLDGVLRFRSGDLCGILNGIDTAEWNPSDDPALPKAFDATDLTGKAACKAALQQRAGLPVRPEIPLFSFIGRLAEQKGVDLLALALQGFLDLEVQFVLLGTGSVEGERFFAQLARARPDRCAAFLEFDAALSHQIEAGADFFVMPSRFEPCGLNQMYSLRYGTLPIVRHTGGLADTVQNLDEASGEGTGFVFHDLSAHSLYNTLCWATAIWYDQPQMIEVMRARGMSVDHSWDKAAGEYEELYHRALARRRG
jgi:starch synthase